jgi:signal transduction histidine kinase
VGFSKSELQNRRLLTRLFCLPQLDLMRLAGSIAAAIGGSLKLKLSFFLVVILGLIVGLVSWRAITMQESQLLRVSRAHLTALQELLKTVVTASMLARDRENVQIVIEALGSHEDIERVRIFDTQSLIHFSSRRDERGQYVGTGELARTALEADPAMLASGPTATNYTLVQPMFNQPACFSCHDPEQKILGMLQVSLSSGPTRRQLAGFKRLAVAAAMITLGMIVAAIWFALTFMIDRPLQRLVAAMARAEHGDLSARAGAHGHDELGRLAHHFNNMLSQLQVAQEQLNRHHQEQLARADRLATIGEMAATLAHEIRNPLSGLLGVLSALSRDFPDSDPRREVVREGRSLVDRMNKTIENMLHYARPSLPHFRPVKLDDMVDRSVSLVQGEARKTGVQIVREANTANRCGGDAESPTIRADPHQVLQVLVNLIRNAIQACPTGGQVRVCTCLQKLAGDKPLACVEIEDTGKGMTADELAQVFNPFFTTKLHGTGLGLPIAQQIIEYHEGRIALTSQPGQGTRVEVDLPAHRESRAKG